MQNYIIAPLYTRWSTALHKVGEVFVEKNAQPVINKWLAKWRAYIYIFYAKSQRWVENTSRNREKKSTFPSFAFQTVELCKIKRKNNRHLQISGWRVKRERSENSAKSETKRWLIEWTRRKQKGIQRKRFAPLIIITRETEKFLFLSFQSWAARSRAPNLIIAAILQSLRKSLTVLFSQTASTWQWTAMRCL